jgi:hypothetical protein
MEGADAECKDVDEEEDCIFTMSYEDRLILKILQRRHKPPTPADWRYRTDFEAKMAKRKPGEHDPPHKETLFDKLYSAYLAEIELLKDQQQVIQLLSLLML